jgi:hypothetical protein
MKPPDLFRLLAVAGASAEIVRRPGIAHGIEQGDAPSARDGDKRVGMSRPAIGFQGFEMHPGQRSHQDTTIAVERDRVYPGRDEGGVTDCGGISKLNELRFDYRLALFEESYLLIAEPICGGLRQAKFNLI